MTTIKFVNVHLPQAQAGIFSQVCMGEGQRTRLATSNYWFAPANMKMLYVLCTYGSLQPSLYSSWNSWSFTTSLLDWGLQKAGAGCRLLLPSMLKLTWADQHSHYADCPPLPSPLSPPHGISHYKWALFIVWMFYSLRSPFIPRRGAQCRLGWSQCAVISEPMLNVCWVHVSLKYTF